VNYTTYFFDLKGEVRFNKKKYLFISLFGLCLYFFDIYRLNTFDIGMRNLNLDVSLIGTIGSFLIYSSMFVWLYELAYVIRNNKRITIFLCFPLVIYLAPNVIVGGRQSFMIVFISTFCVFVYLIRENKQYKYKKKLVLSALIVMVGFILYNSFVIKHRTVYDDMNRHYEIAIGNEVSKETLDIIKRTGVFQNQFLQFLHYYSHEIPSFALILQEYEHYPLFGMFQLNYISRRLPESLGLDYMLARDEIERISFNSGTRATLYRTVLGGFIVDFGRAGSLIILGLVGFLMGRSRKKFRKRESLYRLVIQAMLCSAIVFSVEYSPFYEIRWAFAFYWALIIPVIEKLKKIQLKQAI
jgi:oligosaccharide repeat unit polymerase